jgi:hypothetical protein
MYLTKIDAKKVPAGSAGLPVGDGQGKGSGFSLQQRFLQYVQYL